MTNTMTHFQSISRTTNIFQNEKQKEEKLFCKLTDLSRNLPLTLFEGSRRKEDFHKSLKEVEHLLTTFDHFNTSKTMYSIKRLNNILLLSISYHCRTIFRNLSDLSALHFNNTHQNHIRENEIEAGFSIMKDMISTVSSAHQKCKLLIRDFFTSDDREEILGLLLRSILLLNTLRIQNLEASQNSMNDFEQWPRWCWNELGLPLMQLTLSIMEWNKSEPAESTSEYHLSKSYLSYALKNLKNEKYEYEETKLMRESLLVNLEERLTSTALDGIGTDLEELQVHGPDMSRKRGWCDQTLFSSELDHSNTEINSVLEKHYGFSYQIAVKFWTHEDESDSTKELELVLVSFKSKNELQDLISMLLRRTLTYNASNIILNDDANTITCTDIEKTSLDATRVLLPILYVLLTKPHISSIPREDLQSICRALLITAHDNQVVIWTIDTLIRIFAQFTKSSYPNSDNDIYNFVGLIDCVSHVLTLHPSLSFDHLKKMLSFLCQLSVTHCDDEYMWMLLSREPHVLSALVRAATWQSLHVHIIQILWVLSSNPGNQRSIARHPGALASMIRVARENPMEVSVIFGPTGITMDMWKGRIIKLANVL